MRERIAVSSWALHRTIGVSYPDSPAHGRGAPDPHGASPTSILEIPRLLAERGFTQMQLCHFHLPSQSEESVSELKGALSEAGVKLHALLIDDGDLSHPENGDRDADWIEGWLRTAEALGAERARVIAGRQPYSDEAFLAASERMARLLDGTPVRIEIENWHELMASPDAVIEMLDLFEGGLGLCADFGNWPRPRKYQDLPRILPRAETIHAKLEFVAPESLDEEDAAAMLGAAQSAGFEGTYVLVNGGIGDSEWEALEIQREAIAASL